MPKPEPTGRLMPEAPAAATGSRGNAVTYALLYFNERLWRRAKWRGMFYEIPDGDLPRVGLLFEDEDAGSAIFREWRERFGVVDQFDELRISFVFGTIPGQPDGYSVVLSPDLPGVVNRFNSSGMRPRPDIHHSHFVEQARYHRMETELRDGRTPEVERFRRIYSPGTPFLLGPTYISRILSAAESRQALFDTTLAIRKQICYFRDVSTLRRDRDSEACVGPCQQL